MPPSPPLSKRSTMLTYFSETISVIDQNIIDSTASTLASLNGRPCGPLKRLLEGVQRAGADVAVDDAERSEGQYRQRGFAARRGCRRRLFEFMGGLGKTARGRRLYA